MDGIMCGLLYVNIVLDAVTLTFDVDLDITKTYLRTAKD